MAREILFRAKRLDNGEWVEGGYVYSCTDEKTCHIVGVLKEKHYIVLKNGFIAEIDVTTLCQYTGLTDKNGNMIYENDVVKVESGVIGSPFMNGMIGKIIYTECAFFIEPKDKTESRLLFDECAEYEVIGNIFDNPELLGGADNG